MATSGGQPGNQNASHQRPFKAAVNRVLATYKGMRQVDALEDIAKQLIDAALHGEQWAIREIADRLDGKPAQQMEVSGSRDAPLSIVYSRRDTEIL